MVCLSIGLGFSLAFLGGRGGEGKGKVELS